MTLRPSQLREASVVWLVPAFRRARYWDDLLLAFARLRSTIVLTADWDPAEHDEGLQSLVRREGRARRFGHGVTRHGYRYGFSALPLRVVRWLFRSRADAIITSSFTMWTALAVLMKPFSRARVFIYLSGSSPSADMVSRRVRTTLRRFIARRVDGAFTNTNRARDYLVGLGMETASVHAFPLMVPRIRTRPERAVDGGFVFVYAGRVISPKGVWDLVSACDLLTGHDWRLRIVGDGEDADALRAALRERPWGERAEFLGWLPREQVQDEIAAADTLVFPTYDDVWGMVALEAMAVGTPVICSIAAGASELVEDGVNGLVVQPGDAVALASAMQSIMQSNRASRYGESAVRTMRSHSPELVAQRLDALLPRRTGR